MDALMTAPRPPRIVAWLPGTAASFSAWLRQTYSASGLLYGTVILLNAVLVLSGLVLAHYLGIDVISSLTQLPLDDNACVPAFEGLGNHCFGDYALVRQLALMPNPWIDIDGFKFNYPAAGMMPHGLFTLVGVITGSSRVGLYGYLLVLIVGMTAPAVWATKGKAIWIRILTGSVFGVLSAPALMVLDRGNSVGLLAPILLVLLVALRREQYLLATVAIVLGTMVKPQFVVLLVVLLVVRRWKFALISVAGIGFTNLLPYLFWPKDFPSTILLSLQNILSYGGGVSLNDEFPANVSFAEPLHSVEIIIRMLAGRSTQHTWVDGHQNLVGAVILLIVVAALVVLGKRIPGHIAAILLAATACLFPGVSWSYYLVFAIPVAAVLLRDPLVSSPDRVVWKGVLDDERLRHSWLGVLSDVLLVIATAFSVGRLLLPEPARIPGRTVTEVVRTTGELAPLLWLLAITATLLAWTVARDARLQRTDKDQLTVG